MAHAVIKSAVLPQPPSPVSVRPDQFALLDTAVTDALTPSIGFDPGAFQISMAGISMIGDLAEKSRCQLGAVHGLGTADLDIIEAWLIERDLGWESNVDAWRAHRSRNALQIVADAIERRQRARSKPIDYVALGGPQYA